MLLSDGRPVVADFGIARAIDAAGAAQLIETGMAISTRAYMSPEQATGESTVHGRADTYALACMCTRCWLANRPTPVRMPKDHGEAFHRSGALAKAVTPTSISRARLGDQKALYSSRTRSARKRKQSQLTKINNRDTPGKAMFKLNSMPM